MKLVTLIRAFFLGLTLLTLSLQPAMADVRHTIESSVGWIVEQTQGKVTQSSAMRIARAVFREAKMVGLDPYMVLSVMAIESRFNASAKNPSGASGLMQVVPVWHKDKIKGRNLMDVDVNVEVGVRVLSDCMDRAKDNVRRALRCYLGGPEQSYASIVKSHHDSLRRAEIAYRFENKLPIQQIASFTQPRSMNPRPELPLPALEFFLVSQLNESNAQRQ